MEPEVTRKQRPWALYALALVAAITVVAGVWGRVRNLGFPPRRMWDEIYFPVFARKYLDGVQFFDLHPPLGKFIMATSIAVFGDTPIGWRLMPAVFGCALILLGAVLGWYLTQERVGALLTAAFFAGETIFVAYSRTGIMDGILVFFTLATFLAALWARRGRQVVWVAVLLGMAISIKWAVLPVAVPAGYVLWRKGLFKPFVAGLWLSFVVYVLIVYVERIIFAGGNLWAAWQDVFVWHLQAANKITAAIPNPWSSPWWSWPLMMRPIRFFFGANAEGQMQVVAAIGNPLLWWSSTIAVIVGILVLARRKFSNEPIADDPLVPVLLGYVSLLLPWVPGSRIPYIYNYFPCYVFAILALVCLLCGLWGRRPWGSWAVVAFSICVLAVAVFFLPLAAAIPLSAEDLLRRIWFDSWFYVKSVVP